MEKRPEIEKQVDEELDKMIALLQKKEEIIRYQQMEKEVQENDWLDELVETIKDKQRDLVNFEYYEKPEAYQATLKELDRLNKELDENITVKAYKDSLWEANEVVQLLFSKIEAAANSSTDTN